MTLHPIHTEFSKILFYFLSVHVVHMYAGCVVFLDWIDLLLWVINLFQLRRICTKPNNILDLRSSTR
jgi:hypothetical protein